MIDKRKNTKKSCFFIYFCVSKVKVSIFAYIYFL